MRRHQQRTPGGAGGTARGDEKKRFLVAIRPGETPVPIPNTMVKARAADGTTLETVWESRWPPDSKKELWKGRAETALMHLENCIRRNKKLIDRDIDKKEQD